MHAETPLHDLGIWPSPAEILQGEYPEWRIWRDVNENGRHGEWVAQHHTMHDLVLRASDINDLRQHLETARREAAERGTTPAPP
ncbi:hypothetical protein ACQP1V_42845 (plasmid) [Microtetraspora malaysiensis]|uniref:hypothetical protein n=1 Tax=Microtetraspora malaysiensis TaxID=161358 RepID=UPI003D9167F1